ncbi:MAG: uroporphyrinogen-III synthase [Betaproteobacteria bacterium]|nr:uroporphyrinogen-III synthase [Betaproteobacteria bacterium]
MASCDPAPQLPGLLITRPWEQGMALARRIADEGGQAWRFPTIEISALPLDEGWVNDVLASADWLVFISANAVQQGWPLVQRGPMRPRRLAAVGRATANRLMSVSQQSVLFPSQGADSEALLALPELAQMNRQEVVIVRGRGGREWLKLALEARGARVRYLECYERRLPQPDLAILDEALSRHALVSVQSTEALHNLWQLAGETRHSVLQQRTFLVPHPRVAKAALNLGATLAQVTGPGEDALVDFWKNLKQHHHE